MPASKSSLSLGKLFIATAVALAALTLGSDPIYNIDIGGVPLDLPEQPQLDLTPPPPMPDRPLPPIEKIPDPPRYQGARALFQGLMSKLGL